MGRSLHLSTSTLRLYILRICEENTWNFSTPEFKKYEKYGFATPTGKVELYSTILEDLGYDPLPEYEEPAESPISTPELAKDYRLILITGARTRYFYHTEFRQIKSMRSMHPDPIVEIHPETAKRYGISDGDWVWIETPLGKIKQRCRYFDGIDPRVISAQHGWWYPEKPAKNRLGRIMGITCECAP